MKVKIPNQLQTRAEFRPGTFDSERKTVEVVWSTGSKVKRYDWNTGRLFEEELSMSPSHIRLDRFKNGASVLDNHSSYGLRSVIGVVEKASIKDGEGIATIRLSDREDVKGIVRDIENGIIRNLSVGYKVHSYKKLKQELREEEDENVLPVYRAVDWEPMEVSFVCIPADHKSQVRSENEKENDSYEVEIDDTNNGEESMKTKGKAAVKKPVVRNAKPVDAKLPKTIFDRSEEGGEDDEDEVEEVEKDEVEESEEVVKEEKEVEAPAQRSEIEIRKEEMDRQNVIRSAVKTANLPSDFADKLVSDLGMTADKARAEIFKRMEKEQPETRNNTIEVRDMDNKQLRQEATVRGILHRFNPTIFKLKDGDQEFRQDSLIMTARHYLHTELGQRDAFMLSDVDVAKRALHHTSDFPLLLADVSNKSLRSGYESVPATYELFTKINNSVKNFKDINSYQVSKGGMLKEVNEHGEYERGSLVENAEKYRVKKFGLIIGKTWELMVNDDLGAFTDIASSLGQRARELENKMFWDLIIANPLMADGFAFFSAEHNNLGAAAVIGETSISGARTRMNLMKDLDGELISVTPKYLVTPAALQTTADKFLAQITPNSTNDVNVFSGKLTPVTEPRLDAASSTAYYTFAEKSRLAAAEMARLNGQGPQIFTREGFDIDGMEVKIRYVFGMKLIEPKAAQKNPGA